MKQDTHPPYQEVLFIDSATGAKFVIGSTLQSDEFMTLEGKKYPVCRVSVSSASHPVFTGSKQFVDTEGRVDKFLKRYGPSKGGAQEPDEGKEGQQEQKQRKKK